MSDNGDTAKHTNLAEALVAAQKEMPAVPLDGVNPHFQSKHMTLGTLLSKARPVLNRHGIAMTQFPSRAEDGTPTLTTTFLHESGENLSSVAPLLLTKNDPQGQGSAITYMRRYALAAALGISDQEDDDGHAGSRSSPKVNPEAVAPLMERINARREDGMTFDDLALLLGSVGIDAPEKRSVKSVEKRIASLTPEQAAALEEKLA